MTSSPDARVDFMILRIVSIVSEDCFLVNPFWYAIASVIWDLVRAMESVSFILKGLTAKGLL